MQAAQDIQIQETDDVLGHASDGLANTARRAVHVVQISRDEALVDPKRADESRARQAAHAEELCHQAPGSRLSTLVASAHPGPVSHEEDHLVIRPLKGPLRGRLSLWRALGAIHRARPIDVLTTQTIWDEAWLVLAFARVHGIPVLGQLHSDIHSPHHDLNGTWHGRLRLRLALGLTSRFARLRAVNTTTAQRVRMHHPDLGIDVVPVATPLRTAPRSTDTWARTPRVVFIGRLVPSKRLDRWVAVVRRVAEAVPDARFDIIGEGPQRACAWSAIRAAGIDDRATLHGWVPHEQIGRYLTPGAVLLSTSDHEGFGRVAVEALNAGVPIVGSRTTGFGDIVTHGRDGFLRDPSDLDAMAADLVELLRNDGRRGSFGAAGAKAMRRRFAPEELRRQWMDSLFETASATRGAEPSRTPAPRTLERWARLSRSPLSLLRSLVYERLARVPLRGRVLDIGGGRRSDYCARLGLRGTIESVNINPALEPTWLADLNDPLPFRDASFDTIISMNTLEHIQDDERALREALRVLKPGGAFHLFVPYLYRVHGSPMDFHRHTATWWERFLADAGAEPGATHIEPLVWDRLATAYSFFGSGRLGKIVRPFVLLPAVLHDLRHGPGPSAKRAITGDYAMGYYVSGVRRGGAR